MELSREQRLINKTVERIRQELLNRTTELEFDEWTHQNLVTADVELIAHYQNLLGILRAHKELGILIHMEVKATEELIEKYQAIEGHSYEQIKDSKKMLNDFINLATVANNLEAVLMTRIKQLESKR